MQQHLKPIQVYWSCFRYFHISVQHRTKMCLASKVLLYLTRVGFISTLNTLVDLELLLLS